MKDEQWLLKGDCTQCRRHKYCNTECKKRKENFKDASTLVKTRMPILSRLIDKIGIDKFNKIMGNKL